jgi:multisubunit Na+/H+ antiporter MnhG subunit
MNVIADTRNEWDYKTPYQRFSARIDAWGLGIVLGGCAGFTLSLLIQHVVKLQSVSMHILLAVIGAVFAVPLSNAQLQRSIDESRQRMKDETYRALMERLVRRRY